MKGYIERLYSALKGNFPACSVLRKRGKLDFAVNVPECLQIQAENKDGSSKESRTVAAVSNLATEKSGKFVCQTIEKFLDGIVPSEEKERYIPSCCWQRLSVNRGRGLTGFVNYIRL